jgi:hypothetical protein
MESTVPEPVLNSHKQAWSCLPRLPYGKPWSCRLDMWGRIKMTDRKNDLDAGVQETMAIATSIRVEPSVPRTIVEPYRMPPVNPNNSERDEILQRVSNFKAHQERFAREREEFAASLLKKKLDRS